MKKNKKLIIAISVLAVLAIVFVIGILLCSEIVKRNIDFEEDKQLFEAAKSGTLTKFYANGAKVKGEYLPIEISALTMDSKIKSYYKLDDISSYLKDGFVAVEDKEFYNHEGVNFKRTAFALFNHIFKFGDSFGASTITQQVVKNISGDNEHSARRKFFEIFRAMRIETEHGKEEILELYLNIIPFGENTVGVGAAAEHYFGKEPSELLPEEAAVLIGIANAPTLYNPHTNKEKCITKRNVVLASMRKEGVISEGEFENAKNSELCVVEKDDSEVPIYSWFIETVIEDCSQDYARAHNISARAARLILLTGGYEIYTTENIYIQRLLDDYFEDFSNFPIECRDGLDFSMVICDAESADLLGIVGSIGKKGNNLILNHATIPHTPASVLKPLALYAPLIDSGKINWATVFDDVPIEFINGDRAYPANSPNVYQGLITVKDALAYSKNTVAIRLYNMIGGEAIYSNLKNNFGFDTLIKNQVNKNGNRITDIAPSPLALGQLSRGVGLRRLTEAYTVFSSYGVLNKGRSYTKVIDSFGRVVLQNAPESKRVFKKQTAEIMNQLLMNVTDYGTAKSITLGNTVDTAGKTGTSGGNLDKLFIGYTPYFAAGIRCSYNDSKTAISQTSPSHIKIWDSVMNEIHSEFIDKYSEDLNSFSTQNLIYEPYCKDSGELFSENCILDPRGDRLEYGYFTSENKPSGLCKTHIPVRYDIETEGIAHDGCPNENIILVSLLNIEKRSFEEQVTVLDAEYVYYKMDKDLPRGESYDVPYFQYAIPEGKYVGIGKKKKQFNHSCYIHD